MSAVKRAERVAIVGLGPMGLRHLESALLPAAYPVIAACDRRPEGRDKARLRHPELELFDDVERLLDEVTPDILVIATNGPSHAAIAMQAMGAGIRRILCEKPIATSVADADRMACMARTTGTRLLINHELRWAKDFVNLRSLLQSGVIGKLGNIVLTMGAGGFATVGIHFIDLFHYLTDSETTSVVGYIDDRGLPNPRGPQFRDPGAYGVVHLSCDARVFLDMSEDLGIPHQIQIHGMFGWIAIDEMNRSIRAQVRPESARSEPLSRYSTPLTELDVPALEGRNVISLIRQALDQVAGDQPLGITPEEAARALEAVVAFHVSHELGNRPVRLPLTPDFRERHFAFP